MTYPKVSIIIFDWNGLEDTTDTWNESKRCDKTYRRGRLVFSED